MKNQLLLCTALLFITACNCTAMGQKRKQEIEALKNRKSMPKKCCTLYVKNETDLTISLYVQLKNIGKHCSDYLPIYEKICQPIAPGDFFCSSKVVQSNGCCIENSRMKLTKNVVSFFVKPPRYQTQRCTKKNH